MTFPNLWALTIYLFPVSVEPWKPKSGWYPAPGSFDVAQESGSWRCGCECRGMVR